jgi:hypothetical protein
MVPFRAPVLAAATASLMIFVPAASANAGHGHACGKGHAKHSHAVGKSCAKPHSGVRGSDRSSTAPKATTVSPAVVKACRDEQAADPAAFTAKYGDAQGREAMGNCIRQHAGDAPSSTGDAPSTSGDASNPAKQCAAEKSADPAAFQAKYADAEGHEAFGHCVSQHAKAQSGDEPSDTGDDQADAPDDQADAPDDPADAPDQPADGADSGATVTDDGSDAAPAPAGSTS